MPTWNLWHGCHKLSPGCLHCYVYRTDSRHDRDAGEVRKTGYFDLPLRRNRQGEYKLRPEDGIVYTCFTSDFLLEDADDWRADAWAMMRKRPDLTFLFITKRIARLDACLPPDWGDGYENVHIGCTAEDQKRAEERLPLFLAAPIQHKSIVCEPLLERVDLSLYLTPAIEEVIAGGESGYDARLCDFAWIQELREQCVAARVPFHFKQTGAHFRKDGRVYRIERRHQHSQAAKADIEYRP